MKVILEQTLSHLLWSGHVTLFVMEILTMSAILQSPPCGCDAALKAVAASQNIQGDGLLVNLP
jgi:hypothetical protein